ncbi:MAG TPA: TonB-dependent receptor [Vicinamibacterales bacterium]|nr:TonB-dependent receptor [Vicinamibacterales bacterium]
MTRFYPILARTIGILLIAIGFTAATAAAQAPAPAEPPAEPRAQPMLVTEIPEVALTDLPSSSDLYSLLETMQADLISDRMDTGGLGMGQPPRIGAHGSTWTQTQFRIGDIGVTDPSGSGTPLFMPGVLEWDHVNVQTGLMPVDVNAPGLAITLTPRRPAAAWTRSVEGFFAPPGLQAGRTVSTPPAIEHIDGWQDGSLLLSGPVIPGRLGVVFAANVGQSSRFERTDLTPLDSSIVSGFAHIVFTPNARDEIRIVASGQRTAYPYVHHVAFAQPESSEHDLSALGQVTWERKAADALSWRIFAGWAARQQRPQLTLTTSIVTDRLQQGPIDQLLSPGDGTQQSGTLGAHLTPRPFEALGFHHVPTVGATATLGRVSSLPSFTGQVGELVNGEPARVWRFTDPGVQSQWHSTTLAAYAADHVQLLPRVAADVGLRFESVTGAATGSTSSVSWQDLFPRASVRWDITQMLGLSAFAGYGRYGYELPLNWLAYGDPNAPTGSVYRWTGATSASMIRPSDVGALIARVGPGTGGNPTFSAIDPALERPHMDEVTFGFESRPRARTVMRLTATARRERQMVGVVDVGVPDSTYTVSYVTDPGYNNTIQQLPVYNRSPATFGADRYLLTNPANDQATYVGVDITGQTQTDRLFFLFGATAGRSEGLSANRGFQADENDYGVIGEVFTDPNARTYAEGRNFTERGYTIKTSAVYALPDDFHIGVTARYQDGEHFTRDVIAENLNQGPEAIRSFRNGRARFTFTMTVDGRLRKGFTVGGYTFDGILDVYNIFNQNIQVEEFDVTGPNWRVPTALQPPRVIHVGLRFHF